MMFRRSGTGCQRITVHDEVLIGGIEKRDILVVPDDPVWLAKFERHAAMIREVLGAMALRVEHVGSTSVPGLAAKPIIDNLLEVADSAGEDGCGGRDYRAGA
jgi:GrpB-like predicted nucleotidyltransferase (UPF0157 family)